MEKIASNLNSESTSKFLSDGWRLEQQYSKGLKVYQRWEKNLGLLSRIRDILNRMIILICDLKEPKETFDSIKILNSFKLAKFWSGKRILIIEGTHSPVNGNNSNTRTSPSREGTDPLKNETDLKDRLSGETDPLREETDLYEVINSSSNEEIDSSPNGEVNSSFNDAVDLSALEETLIPIEETLIPIEETLIPIEETLIPIEETLIPIEETPIEIEETLIPIEETPIPIEETPIEIEETLIPIEETPIEIQETLIPIEETPIPIEETDSPSETDLQTDVEEVIKEIHQYFADSEEIDQEHNGFTSRNERDRIDSPITSDNMYDDNLLSSTNSRSNGSNDRLSLSSREMSSPLFDDDNLFPGSEGIYPPTQEMSLTIDEPAKNIETSQAVERASSFILSPNPSGPPRFFLEQVHETWIVRNPEEKYIGGKNPNKHDATSSLNENTKKAREQQIEKEGQVRDNLVQEFNSFFVKFSFSASKQKIRNLNNWSEFIDFDVLTDKDEATGETVKKLHSHSYGVSFTQGLRPTMEDAHAAFLLDGHPCFAVFDGHGSPNESDYCAQNMQRVLQDFLTKNHARLEELNDAELILFFKKSFVLLDNEVKSQKTDPKGTTVALNVIIGNRIICINLGDSRTVIIKSENEAVQISKDAKCNDPKYSKKILAMNGYIENNRVMNHRPNPWVRNKISLAVPRDIGGCGITSISPVPTLTHYPVGKYMIIACDGLWDVMTPSEAGEFLNLMESKGFGVDAMSQALVKMALVRNSQDNISVMVIRTTP